VFVQINDENVHHVKEIMDEVFGSENFCSLITFQKTTGSTTNTLPRTSDYILLYAKDVSALKFRKIFEPTSPGQEGALEYKRVEQIDGTIKPISEFIQEGQIRLPKDAKIFATDSIVSKGGDDPDIELVWNGQKFRLSCKPNRHWKPGVDGIKQLWEVNRLLHQSGLRIYKRYFNDFPYREITHVWTDTRGEDRPDYVVQTSTKVIERCILMTTDPGDLVLDPTCGSGTTAYVAEQWGRRWITCDTSRVAIALAKQRLMTAIFDYYDLAHPEEGISSGFRYKTVPHITLKSIANNPEIKEGMSRTEIDRAIAKYADQETLYDQPFIDKSKVRVTGPFTVEAVPAPVVKPLAEVETSKEADASLARSGETLRQREWREELFRTGIITTQGQRIKFSRVEPLPGTRYLHAEAETMEDEPKRAVISFGPEHAPLEQRQVALALEEANHLIPSPRC